MKQVKHESKFANFKLFCLKQRKPSRHMGAQYYTFETFFLEDLFVYILYCWLNILFKWMDLRDVNLV